MADVSFLPVHPQAKPAEFSATVTAHTLDEDQFAMTVDVRFHQGCDFIEAGPNWNKKIDEAFGPTITERVMAQAGVNYPSGKALQDTAATPAGKAAIEKALKTSVEEVLGNFCVTTDAVELRHLKTNDH